MKETITLSVFGQKEELTLDFGNKQLREVLCVCFNICLEKAYFNFDADIDEKFSPEAPLPYMDLNQEKLKNQLIKKIKTLKPNEKLFLSIDYTLIELVKNIFECALYEASYEKNFYSSVTSGSYTPLQFVTEKYNIDISQESIVGLETNMKGELLRNYRKKVNKLCVSVS